MLCVVYSVLQRELRFHNLPSSHLQQSHMCLPAPLVQHGRHMRMWEHTWLTFSVVSHSEHKVDQEDHEDSLAQVVEVGIRIAIIYLGVPVTLLAWSTQVMLDVRLLCPLDPRSIQEPD